MGHADATFAWRNTGSMAGSSGSGAERGAPAQSSDVHLGSEDLTVLRKAWARYGDRVGSESMVPVVSPSMHSNVLRPEQREAARWVILQRLQEPAPIWAPGEQQAARDLLARLA